MAVAIEEVNRGIDEFRFDESTTGIRRFFWDELCDWYTLELSKPVYASDDAGAKGAARATLGMCLETAFRLLHPIMPFITEEVWQKLPASVRARGRDGQPVKHLVVAPFPAVGSVPRDEDAEREMGLIQGVIVAARNIRGELGIKQKNADHGVAVGQRRVPCARCSSAIGVASQDAGAWRAEVRDRGRAQA